MIRLSIAWVRMMAVADSVKDGRAHSVAVIFFLGVGLLGWKACRGDSCLSGESGDGFERGGHDCAGSR